MNKHDRLMNALKEIKAICTKQEDYYLGCGRKCPFLMEEDENGFRGCEVARFTRMDSNDVLDAPSEWGEVELPVMEYPQVPGITPTLITPKEET